MRISDNIEIHVIDGFNPDRCYRCHEFFGKKDERAEIVVYEDIGNGETGPRLQSYHVVVHQGCMLPDEEIA